MYQDYRPYWRFPAGGREPPIRNMQIRCAAAYNPQLKPYSSLRIFTTSTKFKLPMLLWILQRFAEVFTDTCVKMKLCKKAIKFPKPIGIIEEWLGIHFVEEHSGFQTCEAQCIFGGCFAPQNTFVAVATLVRTLLFPCCAQYLPGFGHD